MVILTGEDDDQKPIFIEVTRENYAEYILQSEINQSLNDYFKGRLKKKSGNVFSIIPQNEVNKEGEKQCR